MRTDGYGAVRGHAGVLLTTYRDATSGKAVPTGDNAAGIALIRQAKQLTSSLSQGATTHQTAALSTAKDDSAPLARQEKAASGMVDGKALDAAQQDAAAGNTTTQGKVPHQSEATVQLAGRAGLVAIAGQDLQFANGESIALASGQDTNVAVGKQARIHAGQGIGVAAGLSKAGDDDIGLQLTAGQDNLDVQAQHDALGLLSKDDLKLVSANLHVDFAAAKRIRLATAAGRRSRWRAGTSSSRRRGGLRTRRRSAALRAGEAVVSVAGVSAGRVRGMRAACHEQAACVCQQERLTTRCPNRLNHGHPFPDPRPAPSRPCLGRRLPSGCCRTAAVSTAAVGRLRAGRQRLRHRFRASPPAPLPGYAAAVALCGALRGPGLDEIAPTLMRLPDAPAERRTRLDFLLQETSGKPMLSFLHANAPTADPLTHLCNQMEAVDHEGTAFLIRLADTNALDAVLQVFNDAQRQRFLSDTQWWYFRRDGSLRHASHATGGGGDAESTPYRCTAAQMQQLEALARPGPC